MTAENQDFEIRTGESMTLRIPVTNTDGTEKTITGAAVTWLLLDGDDTLLTKTSAGGTVTVGATYFDVAITAANSAAITPRSYRHQAQVTLSGVEKVVTEGTVRVVKSAVGLL